MKAVDERYKAALIDEYQSYVRAKRTKDAEHVAQVLRDQYDYDVDAQDDETKSAKPESKDVGAAPETTSAGSPPEAAVEPKPAPANDDTKQAAKKTAAPAKRTAASAKSSTDK
ncbi:hypothetical protein ACFZC3_15490 [Streptomyces sp. NPDC007903]|uniref:hypothetical protein n=1 Tax=Streptomyces sp. NPDC007903 TaxID=3364786 RepID=UPI0036E15D4B